MTNIHQFRKSSASKARVEGYKKAAVTYLRETDRMMAAKREEEKIRADLLFDVETCLRRLWFTYGEGKTITTVDLILSNIKEGPGGK